MITHKQPTSMNPTLLERIALALAVFFDLLFGVDDNPDENVLDPPGSRPVGEEAPKP